MKLLHILLSVIGLGTLASCKKSGYEKTKEGSVYYKDRRVDEADYASFEELNEVFAHDKSRGYYRGIAITGAAGASFKALDDHYGKDQTTVFYCDNYIDFKLFETTRKDKIVRVPNADADSFVAIANENVYDYAKDKFRCYYKGVGFAVNDIASFAPLDYSFGKDNKTGYFNLKPVAGSTGRSFTVLSRNFAKDGRTAYYAWSLVDGPAPAGIQAIKSADPASFTAVGLYYATDKNHAFYKDKPLEAADPTTFKQWAESVTDYATDTTHIYFQDRRIREADKATFNLLTDGYAQDKQAIFYDGRPLIGCDVSTFRVLESSYAKDIKHMYYNGKIMAGADPASFAIVGNEADRDAADKKHSYHEGKQVKPDRQ